MFAILSWIQEAGYLPDVESLGMWKGVIALITGLILYWFLAREITGGPNDKWQLMLYNTKDIPSENQRVLELIIENDIFII